MAFDQATRNRLQRFVNDARRVLEEEFTRQLQNDYGMDPKSSAVTELASLRHINDAQRESARILRDTLAHYCAGGGMDARQGLDRIVREQAFTVLNRLAALRIAEARGLLVESVGNSFQAKGFQLYARLAGMGLGETGDAYRAYLFSVFDELSQDLPGLFDRFSPQGRLFPREAALLQVLNLINGADIAPLWSEDETIGWIYQYFNSKEERKAMRDASQAPRNSRELAVRNQFFTPRYVVEFLVDNTLGRLWFNATGGETHLREQCRYLLVKPDEAPEPATKLRDPRSLKLLDPACGSMHFGLYAFDLFVAIYRESWAWEQQHGAGSLDVSTQPQAALKPLSQTYADEVTFLRDVPRMIIEHNIYGVDIDSRAAQIASLALWLRAQRAWHDAGVKAKDRPLIGHGHVVAATAPPAERELRQQFAANLNQHDAELFEKTLQLLKGLPELGVLLQVERELPHLIRQIYVGKGTGLFSQQELQNWQAAEARLREALTQFAQAAKSTYRGRLFAQDALQGLQLIDLCREGFDVVVMNPPFGRRSDAATDYYDSKYSSFKSDIGLAFVDRSASLLRVEGFLGALTSRTFLAGASFDNWRETVLLRDRPLRTLLDLGMGVLDDAMVETCAFTMGGLKEGEAIFVRALEARDKQKEIEAFVSGDGATSHIKRYEKRLDLFLKFPNCIVAYWLPAKIIEGLSKIGTLESMGAATKHGVQTTDDFQFLRLSWEVRFEDRAQGDRWPTLAKGGEYAPYFDNLELCIDWKANGERLKSYLAAKRLATQGSPDWTPWMNSPEDYFRPGLTFPARTASDFSPRILPAGCVFTASGQALLFDRNENAFAYLAGAFTRSFKVIVDAFVCSGDNSVSGSAANTYRTSLVNALPLPCDLADREMVAIGTEAVELTFRLAALSELSPFFEVEIRKHLSLKEFAADRSRRILLDAVRLLELNEAADKKSRDLLGFDNQTLNDFHGPLSTEYEARLDRIDPATLTMSVESLVRLAIEKDGPRRQLTKKTFVSDRKLELLTHVNKVHARTIVDYLEKEHLWHEFFESPAEEEASILFGVAIGRWRVQETATIGDSVRDYLAPLPNNHLGTMPLAIPFQDNLNWRGTRSVHILVDDPNHPNDASRRVRDAIDVLWPNHRLDIEAELAHALAVPSIRAYYSKPSRFFASHLSRYSGSRRYAPIYWPLATPSASYTLWVYYPSLSSQTLYTAINEFVEPKLRQVSGDVVGLRNKGAYRSPDEEKELEVLQALELELIELRDTLLKLAPTYKPNQDDGVQISAAPLWPLFRHKPWQKVLRDTWAKLEKGDYDWAHLAMNYWPERVREKCKTDKSLAIAHGLEDLYIEPEAKPKKVRGKKKAGGDE